MSDWDYGRAPIKPGRPIANTAEERATRRCEKCRHLTVRDNHCVCLKSHKLDAANCGDFSDCSRPRDYFPNFYHRDMRR